MTAERVEIRTTRWACSRAGATPAYRTGRGVPGCRASHPGVGDGRAILVRPHVARDRRLDRRALRLHRRGAAPAGRGRGAVERRSPGGAVERGRHRRRAGPLRRGRSPRRRPDAGAGQARQGRRPGVRGSGAGRRRGPRRRRAAAARLARRGHQPRSDQRGAGPDRRLRVASGSRAGARDHPDRTRPPADRDPHDRAVPGRDRDPVRDGAGDHDRLQRRVRGGRERPLHPRLADRPRRHGHVRDLRARAAGAGRVAPGDRRQAWPCR
jgi:hypothetical protein